MHQRRTSRTTPLPQHPCYGATFNNISSSRKDNGAIVHQTTKSLHRATTARQRKESVALLLLLLQQLAESNPHGQFTALPVVHDGPWCQDQQTTRASSHSDIGIQCFNRVLVYLTANVTATAQPGTITLAIGGIAACILLLQLPSTSKDGIGFCA